MVKYRISIMMTFRVKSRVGILSTMVISRCYEICEHTRRIWVLTFIINFHVLERTLFSSM